MATREDLQRAGADLREALRQSPFWLSLGLSDIQLRYRGSMLGPFWLTITTAVFVIGLGPLYGGLFGLDMRQYLPHLAIGIIVWNFITAVLGEACRTFIDAAGTMKQVRLPRLWHVFHVLWRNVIVFAHNLPVAALVLVLIGKGIGPTALLAVPGFLITLLSLLAMSVVLGIVCARFHDIVQIVNSLLTISFFLTPVMWDPSQQRVPDWIVWLNPFAGLIEVIRAPLLGTPPAWPLVMNALLTLAISSGLAAVLFARYRKHIVFWV